MPNAHGKDVDKTFLSIDTAEERQLIHRDFLAHAFRWTHVARVIGRSGRYRTTKLLDIGCGKEIPLGKMLYSNRFIPEAYCGIDVRDDLAWPEMLQKGIDSGKLTGWSLHTGDCATATAETIGFNPNFITAFEIVEHVEADHRIRILKNLLQLVNGNPEAVLMLSTPNYDHGTGAADNHVDETTHVCLGAIIEDCGWAVTEQYGTFASIADYRDKLVAEYGQSGKDIFYKLHDYYDTNVLATIFAPLFPKQSRNILWVLKPAPENYVRQYPTLADTITDIETEVELAAIADPDHDGQYWHKRLGSSTRWNDPVYRQSLVDELNQHS